MPIIKISLEKFMEVCEIFFPSRLLIFYNFIDILEDIFNKYFPFLASVTNIGNIVEG